MIDLIGAILFIEIHSVIDWYQIVVLNRPINHTKETTWVIIILVVLCIIRAFFDWRMAFVDAISFLPFRWVLFDASLNLMRGKRFDYLGTTSMLDRFLTAHKGWQYILKAVPLIIVSIIDILILHK